MDSRPRRKACATDGRLSARKAVAFSPPGRRIRRPFPSPVSMPRDETGADALDFYLDDLSRVKALPREEELALALVIEDARRKVRAAVLGHRPSLKRLLGLLDGIRDGQVRPGDVFTLPAAAAAPEEEFVPRILASSERLAPLLEGLADSRAGSVSAEIAGMVAELPLNPQTWLRLFEQGLNDPLPAEGSLPEWAEASCALRAAERAKAKLVEHNLRLVVILARRYVGRGLPLGDLIQEGNLGLLRAIDGFDPSLGYRLSTYAAWWIRQAMQRALAEQTRTIRVPRHVSEAFSSFARYARGFRLDAGRPPTAEEIATGLGVPLSQVNAALEIGPDAISLETPLGNDESLELGDVVADSEGPSPAEVLLIKDFANQTREALTTLSEEERAVIVLRFGIGMADTHTVEEVAAERCISVERVRQIEVRALRKLRNARRTRNLRAYARD